MKMRKYLIEITGAIAITGLLLAIAIPFISNKRDSEEEKIRYIKLLGKNVIIGSDTLTMIDYSTDFETIYLSNQMEINVELAEKLEAVSWD
jgi:hypothetical protein